MNAIVTHPMVLLLFPVVWPLVQAALDKPWWTKGRRIALVVAVALVYTGVTAFAGAYPATTTAIVAFILQFLGVAWAAYQFLASVNIKGFSLIDWAGFLTPGGEDKPKD